jgi:hypothetical protein
MGFYDPMLVFDPEKPLTGLNDVPGIPALNLDNQQTKGRAEDGAVGVEVAL